MENQLAHQAGHRDGHDYGEWPDADLSDCQIVRLPTTHFRRTSVQRGFLVPDFITLSCPSRGGNLQITNDVERFACAHCGSEHIVRRGGGIVALAPVIAGLKQVQVGVDKTASELAIKRLRDELINLQAQRQRAAAELPGKLDSITADLEKKVSAHKASTAVRQARQLPALMFMLLAGFFCYAFAISAFGVSGADAGLPAIVALILGMAAVFFGWLLVKSSLPDVAAEQRLTQAQRDADEQTSRIRTEGEETIRVIDAKISEVQKALERHRQIVSQ
jgi:hypothetical protein